MSNRTIKKNRHREDFGASRGSHSHHHDGYDCGSVRLLWTPSEDAYRGSAKAPHKLGAKKRSLPFASSVALGVFHSLGKIEDDVASRLRNGFASLEEISMFDGLLVEHQVVIAANAQANTVPSSEVVST